MRPHTRKEIDALRERWDERLTRATCTSYLIVKEEEEDVNRSVEDVNRECRGCE